MTDRWGPRPIVMSALVQARRHDHAEEEGGEFGVAGCDVALAGESLQRLGTITLQRYGPATVWVRVGREVSDVHRLEVTQVVKGVRKLPPETTVLGIGRGL